MTPAGQAVPRPGRRRPNRINVAPRTSTPAATAAVRPSDPVAGNRVPPPANCATVVVGGGGVVGVCDSGPCVVGGCVEGGCVVGGCVVDVGGGVGEAGGCVVVVGAVYVFVIDADTMYRATTTTVSSDNDTLYPSPGSVSTS